MRASGILLPVFSLPGKYGIGCFSKEAYHFIDCLREAGMSYWQILPLGPTGYGDSPYQSFSTFAGNPYFISLEELVKEGLLTEEECEEADLGGDADLIDYGRQYTERNALLKKAYGRSFLKRGAPLSEGPKSAGAGDDAEWEEFSAFRAENAFWLEDYALFMALKDARGGVDFESWEEELRDYQKDALEKASASLRDEIGFYEFLQYEFLKQWKALRAYAREQGIQIIGDIPVYVSHDSADFWAHRDLFLLDERGRVRMVAGVPPDGFSADGQVWGNPLYDWPKHKEKGYDWWLRRIGKCLELYDVIRIDHFRGFDEYFAVPAGDTSARNGHWEQGPGLSLFEAIRGRYGDVPIIAEDLGYVTETVRKLVRDTGFPNMKVLEFAFDSRDSTGAAEYLPFRYQTNCVVYTGTHDNETVLGWIDNILPEELQQVKDYLDVRTGDPTEFVDKMILMAHSSVADTSIIPMQDYLRLDNSARINHPSTQGCNWKWRMRREDFSPALIERIRRQMQLFGRERT